MNVLVWKIIDCIFFRAGPKITVPIEKPFLISVNGCHKAIASNIEFSAINKKRLLNVLLDYHSPVVIILKLRLQYTLNLSKIVWYLDSGTAIGVFPRLDNPNIITLIFLLKFIENFKKSHVIGILASSLTDVKSQGNSHFKRIQVSMPIVSYNIPEKSLLIG